jgi:hypothetical protein
VCVCVCIYIYLVSIGQSEDFDVINCGIARVIIWFIEWSVINAVCLNHFYMVGWIIYFLSLQVSICTNLIAMFSLCNSKNIYTFNCLLKIATCFDHPTGHH